MGKILEGMYVIMGENDWAMYLRDEHERTAMVYIAANAVKEGDIRATTTNIRELEAYFNERGFTKDELLRTVRVHDVTFKPAGHDREKVDGQSMFVPRFIPTQSIRLLAETYLNRHPEMKSVVANA